MIINSLAIYTKDNFPPTLHETRMGCQKYMQIQCLHQFMEMIYSKTSQESTSTMSRANKQADSFCEEMIGVAAFKHESTRDPTILLWLFISLSLNISSSQYSMRRAMLPKFRDPFSDSIHEFKVKIHIEKIARNRKNL